MVSIIMKIFHTVSSEIELFSAAQQRSTNHLSKGWIITHSHKTNNLLLLADIIKITFQPHWAESKGLRPQGIVTVFSASGHFDSLRLLIFCLRACFVASTGAQCALCTYYMCVCGVHIYDSTHKRGRLMSKYWERDSFVARLQGSENRSLGINTLRPICLHNWDLLLISVLKWRFSVTHILSAPGKLKCECFVPAR